MERHRRVALAPRPPTPRTASGSSAEPELLPTAVEEFLRAYAPVTMARLVPEDIEFDGCPMKADDWVLLPFPPANRDPEQFDDADEVVIDRQVNRHAAFGLGIHRCLGSHLARMELRVALEEWLARFPDFTLADPDAVTWSAGQVRGPAHPADPPGRLTAELDGMPGRGRILIGRASRLGGHPPRLAGPGHQERGTSFQGRSLSVRGSPGRPSTRSPRMLRWISEVPPSMELARARRNILRRRPRRARPDRGCSDRRIS